MVKAAYLMTGGLFRSEIGEVVDGSRRLSADELALTLGRILDTHPVAVSHSDRPLPASHPDADNAELGYMSAIRQAADDGSIFEPETRRAILRRAAVGAEVSPSSAREAGALLPDRHDLEGSPGESRGEYWLAPNFRRFFREWLDYDSAITSFKDTPTATSAYEGNRGAARGFNNLQGQYYGSESNLVEQLDDTVARAVVHSHDRSEDVFRHLLTTREWRLPASDRETAPVACETSDDCADNPALIFDSCDSEGYCINGLGERTAGETRCYRPEEPRCPRYLSCAPNGFCGSSVSGNTSGATFVYGVDDPVNAYPDRRWQTMTSQRIGVLTHPAWLAAHGGNFEDDASLVLRGKWIREQLFCETVPPLDLVMVEAQLVPSREDLNARDRMEESFDESEDGDTRRSRYEEMNRSLPFETFNHAGFERASDHGSAPDASTVITNLPDPSLNRNYSTTQEFIEALAGSAYARRGFVRHAFRYFMGRPEVLADGCTLAEMEAALDETGSFFAMMEALVVSQTLTHRHIAEGESR